MSSFSALALTARASGLQQQLPRVYVSADQPNVK